MVMDRSTVTEGHISRAREQARKEFNALEIHEIIESRWTVEQKITKIKSSFERNNNLLSQRNENDCTPLLLHNVELRILQYLVEQGANINAFSEVDGTILHRYHDKDTYIELVSWALDKGFTEVNRKDRNGVTPIMFALKATRRAEGEGVRRMVKKLQSRGALLNEVDNAGNSVLFYALEYSGRLDLFLDLIEYGADVNYRRNYKRQNPVHKVVREDYNVEERIEILKILAENNRDWLNEKDDEDYKPILQRGVHLKLLKQLVELGADIDTYSERHGTLLHTCSRYNYEELVTWAFGNGFALVNHRDQYNKTPLMRAMRKVPRVRNDVLEMFSRKGANFNAEDVNGDSVLFHALKCPWRVELVELIGNLLRYGADVNHRNNRGRNVIHQAVQGHGGRREDKLRIIRRFLAIRHDLLEGEDDEELTPLMMTARNLIRESELFKGLKQIGADINAYSSDYGSILHVALSDYCSRFGGRRTNNDEDEDHMKMMIRWILQNGFRLFSCKDKHGRTPLDMATDQDLKDLILEAEEIAKNSISHVDIYDFYQ